MLYVNEKIPIMTAFSHFCYQNTNNLIMVSDLQGCNTLLTDPVIHSVRQMYYEQGDCGQEGMMGFFASHKCNEYCKALGLKNIQYKENQRIT